MFRKLIDFKSTNPKVNQRSKNIVTYGTFGIFALAMVLVISSYENNRKKIKINDMGVAKNRVDIVSSINVRAEDEWLNRSENDLKTLREQNATLLKRLELLEKQWQEDREIHNKTIDTLKEELTNNRMQLADMENSDINNDREYNEYGEIIDKSNGIITIDIDLEETIKSDGNDYNDLDNYIPAGSYVRAKILSGADVSTGVNSQSDPNNMMFEIISPAYAPKHRGKMQEIKKIEGCRITGAATGQLWTEKAYIRLLKMICSFEKGRVAEFNVRGYVASFAKEGVRGRVVSREGYFTSMAFLSGAIEGVANVAKTAYAPTLEVQTGLATQTINSANLAKQAGATGFSRAAEMLSDYYIKRAEQYQSVIDVPTGIEVEIVFQEGVDLTKNTSFKLKTNEIEKQFNSRMERKTNYNVNSNTYFDAHVGNDRANALKNNGANNNDWDLK